MLKKMRQVIGNLVWMSVMMIGVNSILLAQGHRVFERPTAGVPGPRTYEWCCVSSKYHTGIDYCPKSNCSDDNIPSGFNDSIWAAASGRVAAVYRAGSQDRGLGNVVVIEHKMDSGPNLFTLYAHLASINSGVVPGLYVTKGFAIGKMGKTGSNNGAGGKVHLHFEIKTHAGLGVVNGTAGDGMVGYASPKPLSNLGYRSPANYINLTANKFQDISLDSDMPSSLRYNQPASVSLRIFNPFSLASRIDLRLALYTPQSGGIYLGSIEEKPNLLIAYSGSATFNFYKSRLYSTPGNYKLQLEYRVPGSSAWFVMPPRSTALNPRPITITY